MTIARRGTNFNWQLRMLQGMTGACGGGGCPAPCLTVTDPDQIPADASDCPSGLIAIDYPGPTDYILWDGLTWKDLTSIVTLTSTETQGGILPGWELSINGVWYTAAEFAAGITFDDPISIATFQYRTITGCILDGRTTEIVTESYYYFTVQDPIGFGSDFLDWTINGEPFFQNRLLMQSFGGDAFYYIINAGNNPYIAYLWYYGSTAPTITLLDNLGVPVPVVWAAGLPSAACFSSDITVASTAIIAQYFNYNEITAIDFNISVTGLTLDDPGFITPTDDFIKQMFGIDAEFILDIVGLDVHIEVNNIYLTPAQFIFFSGDVFNFAPAVCPP